MPRPLLALLLVLAVLPGCKRTRPPATTTNAAPPGGSVARGNPPAGPEGQSPPGPGQAQQPQAPPGVSSWHGGDRPAPTNARGTATISVEGTPLADFLLYGLTLENGAFRLDGQGLALVGRISREWAGTVGKPVAILPEVAGIGASEF